MAQAITVILVDDHQLVRWGVRSFLEKQPGITVLGEASSGAEALGLAAELVPDVVLMDLVMPDMDGVETTRRLKQVSPASQVIILTSYHDDEHIFPAIRAGALSYILKDVGSGELAEIVRKAARGEAVMHPHVAARVMRELREPHTASGANSAFTSELSEREVEVLRLIAEGRSNTEIAERLVISEHTVKRHVSNILSKLHLADRTQAAVYAWREGVIDKDG
ncbi:MAG TPA: response regulator transcription factor [Ktedonobacterales bacterium]|jgi:NarL family two-component system response regulator LiaR|nr:response regulator transcription factor [Ktedonobacterales bacterium]